ncbi:MAG: hypothetical protein GDYSWBUE_001008 [Candidatus Fervidibacterota bacterium]
MREEEQSAVYRSASSYPRGRRKRPSKFVCALVAAVIASAILVLAIINYRKAALLSHRVGVQQESIPTPIAPTKPSIPQKVSLPSDYAIPILCYHDFRDSGKHRWWATPPKRFEAQLQMLNALGFTFLTMSEAVDLIQGRWNKPIPKRPVVITIDDGFRSAYKVAYPLLSKYGAKATLFVYTNAIGSFGLSWEQLREMTQSGRIEVASHTVTHPHPDHLKRLKKQYGVNGYRERLVYEFATSKRLLEQNLGVRVNGLAYTGGVVDAVAMEIARAVGYKWAVKIDPQPFKPTTDVYCIPRYAVNNGTTVMALRAWLMGGGLHKQFGKLNRRGVASQRRMLKMRGG